MSTAFIIPIDRQRKKFASLSGLYAVRDAYSRCYSRFSQPDWPAKEEWVTKATTQTLDMAIRGTSREKGTVGTVDCKGLPDGTELVFVAMDCAGPGNWKTYGKQIRPSAEVCED